MLPPAPGLLSITKVQPVFLAMRCVSARELVSVPPPGGNGMTKRMGFVGYCAAAGNAAMHARTKRIALMGGEVIIAAGRHHMNKSALVLLAAAFAASQPFGQAA